MSAVEIFYSRSHGIPLVRDQYADGKATRVWRKCTVDSNQRIQNYKNFLTGFLRKHDCVRVLDVACGTGVDSMMLLDEGFKVVSTDASDKMLKHALKARWENRRNIRYDEWVIEEASWETLPEDIQSFQPNASFDAIICLGNSFAHLLDEYGDQRTQKMSLKIFAKVLRPGGLLFIDHRNYEAMINSGATPGESIYYTCKYPIDIRTSVLVVQGKPELVTLDYCIDAPDEDNTEKSEFRLSYYPHRLDSFTRMLDDAFSNTAAQHRIYADFKPLELVENPGFYIHIVQKAK